MRHGFEKHKAKPFSAAGQREDIAVCIARGELLGRQAVWEANVWENAAVASKLLEPGPIISVTDEHERNVLQIFQDLRQRHNERVRSFILLGRVPSADRQNDSLALRETRRRQQAITRVKARRKIRVEAPGEPLDFVLANA